MTQSPENFDWPAWVARWERMQARYLVERRQRFETIARLIAAAQGTSPLILDLGCGPGSLMAALLEAIPGARIVGLDMDETLLLLAEKRLARYGERARVMLADLRIQDWIAALTRPPSNPPISELRNGGTKGGGVRADAIVSATALHWLSPDQLSTLYRQIASLLNPGGIFLNADHVASGSPAVQAAWVQHRERMRAGQQTDPTTDDWNGFWKAYLAALGLEAQGEREEAFGGWQGIEDGLPLAWHFDQLRQAGFASVDCFWRCDCDAVYGGIQNDE